MGFKTESLHELKFEICPGEFIRWRKDAEIWESLAALDLLWVRPVAEVVKILFHHGGMRY